MIPFDPGPEFRFADIFESTDNKVPPVVMAEIDRLAIDETGWARFGTVDGRAFTVYTAALDGSNSLVGRLVLSAGRFDVSWEMAHNLYIRYSQRRITQFFFHRGWNPESARKFVNEFEGQLLASRARGLTVRELVEGLRDQPLRRFWNQFLCKG